MTTLKTITVRAVRSNFLGATPGRPADGLAQCRDLTSI